MNEGFRHPLKRFEEANTEHLAHGIRAVEGAFLDAEAQREEQRLTLMVARAHDAGLSDAADWFESALCAVRGGRKELGG